MNEERMITTRIKKSRKAQILDIIIIGGVVMAFLIFMWYYAIAKPDNDQDYIGQNQLAILQTSAKAEKVLTYIDNAANVAFVKSFLKVSEMGAASSEEEESSECGTYYNYYYWQSVKDGTVFKCYPDKVNLMIDEYMKSELATMFSLYPGPELRDYEPNYELVYKDNTLKGLAINPLFLDIVVEEKEEKTEEPAPPPTIPVTKVSGPLTIVIDAGHGAADSGTRGGGYPYYKDYSANKEKIKTAFSAEANKNMYIVEMLAEKLRAYGHDVRLIRYGQEFYCSECKTTRWRRTVWASKQNADIFISIHNNAAAGSSRRYSQRMVTYPLDYTCRNSAFKEVCEESKKLAQSIGAGIKQTTGVQYRVRQLGFRGSTTSALGVFNNAALRAATKSHTKVTLLEMAAINDPDLNDPVKIEEMVDGIVKGIHDYAGTTVIAVGGTEQGSGLMCSYCFDGRESLKSIFGQEVYDECKGNGKVCCKQKCPPDSVMLSNLPVYKNQGRDFGSLGACSEGSRTVAAAGCGAVSSHMAFYEAGKDISVESLFCAGGENEMYTPGEGTRVEDLTATIKKHLPESTLYQRFTFDDIAKEIKNGHPVVLDIKQKDSGIKEKESWQNFRGRKNSLNERCYETAGHWVNVVGVSKDHLIVNDPATGKACSYDKSLGERQVWSKEFVDDIGYYGVALSPEIPQGVETPGLVDASQTDSSAAAGGLNLVKTEYKGREMYKIEVDPSVFDIEIRDTTGGTETDPTKKTVEQLMDKEDVAAINGGFFKLADGQSASNLVINGHLVSSLTEPWFTSCFVVKDENGARRYGIIDVGDFKPEDYVFAVCSPWLVKDHKFNFPCDLAIKQTGRPDYCRTESRQRSVLGIKDNGQMDLIAVKSAIVPQLGETLSSEYKYAIMLDGGGSTSMEYHYGGTDLSFGWDTGNTKRPVGNAVVVNPKGTVAQTTRSQDCRVIQEGEEMPFKTSQPCISVELIDEILKEAKSPAAGQGKAFYDFGVKYGIDPAIALAFFKRESSFGKLGTCTDPEVSKNPGNLRYSKSYPWRCSYEDTYYSPKAQARGCSLNEQQLKERPYCRYDTWAEGIEAWYESISKTPYMADGKTTVDSVFPTYTSSKTYLTDVRKWVNEWRQIQSERGGIPDSPIASQRVPESNQKILNQALLMENIGYNWAGRYGYAFGPTNYKMNWGLDCVGLQYAVSRQLGIISDSTDDKVIFQSCKDIIEKIPGQKITDKEIRDSNFEVLMPGDFVCVKNYGHAGIYFGEKDGDHLFLNARGVGPSTKTGCSDNCCRPDSDYRVRTTPMEDYLSKGSFAALRVEPSLIGKYADSIPADTPKNFVCTGDHSTPNYDRYGGTVTQTTTNPDGTVTTKILRTLGKYYLNPSFSIDLPFRTSDYGLVEQQIRGFTGTKGMIDLVADCEKGGKKVETCVAEAVDTINSRPQMKSLGLVMFNGPCDPEENLWSDLVEDFGDCVENSQDNCYCELTLNQSEQSDYDGEMTVIAEKKGGTKISFDTFIYQLSYDFNREIEETKALKIKGRNSVYYLNKDGLKLYLEEKKPSASECKGEKRSYKFCVRTPEKAPAVKSEGGKTYKQKNIEYKFAIEFPDPTAPTAVEGLKAADKEKAESSILLEWDAPKEKGAVVPDLNHYLIYCSETPFVLEDGEPVVAGIKSPQKIDAGTKDHMKVQAGWCGDKKITDGQEYHFAVLAVDNSGNRGAAKEVTAISLDDLAPGKVGIEAESQSFETMTTLTASSDSMALSWKKPEKNEDGTTEFDDFKEYWVYMSETQPDFTVCMAGCTVMQTTSATLPAEIGKAYYVAVIAVDTNGNHITGTEAFKAPDQWSSVDASECYISDEGDVLYREGVSEDEENPADE